MINAKDVITMLVPFPNINSGLAAKAHMYICWHSDDPHYRFVKCQSLKPYMIGNPMFRHYIDEPADLTRNPFNHPSRIDCDKSFVTGSVVYDDELKTSSRPDVCDELYGRILDELFSDGYTDNIINEYELVSLNRLIRWQISDS